MEEEDYLCVCVCGWEKVGRIFKWHSESETNFTHGSAPKGTGECYIEGNKLVAAQ